MMVVVVVKNYFERMPTNDDHLNNYCKSKTESAVAQKENT